MAKQLPTVQYKGIAEDTNGNIWVIPTGRKGTLLSYDKVKKKKHAIRYATNQTTIWLEDQNEFARLDFLYLVNGFINVQLDDKPKLDFLDAHPLRGIKFEKIDLQKEAESKLVNDEILILIKSELLAKSKEKGGAIMLGSLLVTKSKKYDADAVSYLSPAEIRAALYVLAEGKPSLFTNEKMTKVTCFTDPSFLKLDLILRATTAGIIKPNLAGSKIMWGNGEVLADVTSGVEWKNYLVDYFSTESGEKVQHKIAKAFE